MTDPTDRTNDQVMSATWRRATDVLWRSSLDSVMILGRADTEPLVLAGTGGAVWDLLAVPIRLADLATLLANRYGAPIDEIISDVAPVLVRLERSGAIERIDGR